MFFGKPIFPNGNHDLDPEISVIGKDRRASCKVEKWFYYVPHIPEQVRCSNTTDRLINAYNRL